MNNAEILAQIDDVHAEITARLSASDDPHKGNLQTRRHMRPETQALRGIALHLTRIRGELAALDTCDQCGRHTDQCTCQPVGPDETDWAIRDRF